MRLERVALVVLALALGACAFPKAEKVAEGSGGAASSSTASSGSGGAGAASSSTGSSGSVSATTGSGAGPGVPGTCASGDSSIPCDGLELWLDASILTEGPIASWLDGSPRAHAVTQEAAALQPNARASPGLHGHVLAEFDGVDDFLAVDEGFADLEKGLTLFLVVVPRDTSVEYQPVVYLATDSTDTNYVSLYLRRDGWELNVSDYGAGETRVLTQGTAVRLQARTDWLSGTTMRICRPDFDHRHIPGPAGGARAVNFIGNAVTDSPLKGGVAELILYSRVLGNPEAAQVNGYLSTKWGVCP